MTTTAERKDRILALSATVVIHAALLFLFIYIVLRTPLPPFPENTGMGIEVDFGNLVEGTGNVEDDKMGNMESEETKMPQVDNNKSNESSEAVLTNDAEDESISIKKAEKPKKKEKPVEEVEEKKPEEEKPSSALSEAIAMFNKKKNTSPGGGDGNSGNAGNSGDPNGSPDGTGTGGNGTFGNGANYNLKGRILLKKPEITDDSQEEGKVVVEIIVDETGKVVKATPGARGSTTTNSVLYAKARQAAFSAKFNASPEGVKEQRGTVTFVFILN